MEKSGSAIVLIILGLIVLAFPLLGLIPLSLITGFIVLILGIGLLLSGIMEMGESAGLGILEIILGIVALILGIGFIFNPGLFGWLAGFIVWIVGLIIGLLYVIIGNLFKDNPALLGVLIGLWLLITGIMMLVMKD